MDRLPLDPGALTARLDRELPADAPDGQGGASTTFHFADRLWARIEPVSARVTEVAGGTRALVTHLIWTGWRSDIVAGQRLRKGGRLFIVRLVRDPDETRRFLVLDCEEQQQ
ncbi:phage head closure protein [Rhizobium sp. SAFR-030]|uniref:phage head closure protein n=1 Tax=Rhizobium sp. SAFR-030 TaxID=3387277 RepID=UPI003F7F7B65